MRSKNHLSILSEFPLFLPSGRQLTKHSFNVFLECKV